MRKNHWLGPSVKGDGRTARCGCSTCERHAGDQNGTDRDKPTFASSEAFETAAAQGTEKGSNSSKDAAIARSRS